MSDINTVWGSVNKESNVEEVEYVSFYDKYRDYWLLTTPTILVLTALLKKLSYLSKQSVTQFGEIVNWSNDVLNSNKIQDMRADLFHLFSNAYIDTDGKTGLCNFHPKNGKGRWMYFKYETGEVVNLFMNSKFFVHKNVLDDIEKENTQVYLTDAYASEMLDELCHRIDSVHKHLFGKFRPNATCDYDLELEPKISVIYGVLHDLSQKARTLEDEQFRLYKLNGDIIAKAKLIAPLSQKTVVKTKTVDMTPASVTKKSTKTPVVVNEKPVEDNVKKPKKKTPVVVNEKPVEEIVRMPVKKTNEKPPVVAKEKINESKI